MRYYKSVPKRRFSYYQATRLVDEIDLFCGDIHSYQDLHGDNNPVLLEA